MSKSETAFLREEVNKLASQNDNLQKENANIKEEHLRDMAFFKELDRLQKENL